MINRYDLFEFSKTYKRVMEIELCLKLYFEKASNIVAPDTKFKRLINYFGNSKLSFKYAKYNYEKVKQNGKIEKRNKIKDIIASKDEDKDKFNKFLKIAYLADILNIITEYDIIYKDTQFSNAFYTQKIDLNTLKKYASTLKKLRNIIMHFDVKSYKQNKLVHLDTLAFWESNLYCGNRFIHNLPKIKPTMENILQLIKDNNTELFYSSDREVVDVFDDIAFINGLPVEKFPQYWSIGRKIYSMKRDQNISSM